jgi:hypothetical protein
VTLGPFGQALYQQVLPMHGPDPDGLAEDYIGAVTLANEEIDGYVRDTDAGPGWSVILDVDDTPMKGLRWLGQLVGVALRQQRNGETDANFTIYARDAIRRQGGRQRGTTDAQMSAIQDTLTGTKSVLRRGTLGHARCGRRLGDCDAEHADHEVRVHHGGRR